MSDEFLGPDLDELMDRINERTQWARLSVTIEEIAKENHALVKDLSRYDPTVTVPLLASLITLPEYQSHCIRFEILIALAVAYCCGSKVANIKQAFTWFREIGKSSCILGEDPSENVFVSLVLDSNGDYRVLEGVWESSGFYTQRMLNVIAAMPDIGQFVQIKKSFRSLLTISDIICGRSQLHRYQVGSDELYDQLSPQILKGRDALMSRVTVTFSDLSKYGITFDDIAPFVLMKQQQDNIPSQRIGNSFLDYYPLMMFDEGQIIVALPTSLSIAARNYLITFTNVSGLVNAFDQTLARDYAKLFYDTHLLGTIMRSHVRWKISGMHRHSQLCVKTDEGFYTLFIFFLPSVIVHMDGGGFVDSFQDDGILAEGLKRIVDTVVERFNRQDDFREGLIILVGCGWGKGCFVEIENPDNPHWRIVTVSAADLILLSAISDMTPSYLWRIQDGLMAVKNAGVQLTNANGILNIIGWVRSNNGQFVPSAILTERDISTEHSLIVALPSNMLRDVRVEVDCGYDRHCMVDNCGNWHEVQRVSPRPFFESESALRVYASINDVRRGKLTSMYEGTVNLWATITMPNASDKEAEYHLWEMVNEWLHRIGNFLDKYDGVNVTKHNLKMYIEFLDGDPKVEEEIPQLEDLMLLCSVERHHEPNACRVVFRAGFLAGFQAAKNSAERLIVRKLSQGYLWLIGVENDEIEAETIENTVITNDFARSFHLFCVQQFADYVRDTLPKNLLSINSLDDANARIGLGWRVFEKGRYNKIEGEDTCLSFLAKMVDTLLADISERLKRFDRLFTLRRLVANCVKANAEEEHWNRTSAALIALHDDKQETKNRYVEQMSKFAGANIASRVLIEISLCDSPIKGGTTPSDYELGKLIALSSLVVRIGGLSDAIRYNALPSEITISPLGDILFHDEFGRVVVEPMLSEVMGNKFVEQALRQSRNYENPKRVASIKDKINNEFWEIWKKETGFDLDEARSIIDAIEHKGIEDHTAVLTIRKSEYLSLACSSSVLESVAVRFLEQFMLCTRSNWDTPPKDFNRRDIYPWRFGRRFSFITRPILKMNDDDDPQLMISPEILLKGFAYVVEGAYSGRLEQAYFHTHEMKNEWWGKSREGHTFNNNVAMALSSAGWQVRANIGLPEILKRKTERNYGDVDVIAWHIDSKEVLIIECKDLALARNYTEIASMLAEYQGLEVNGKADRLRKHLDRVELLRNHIYQIKRFTGVQEPQVISCLVCDGIVPMQYAKIDALKDTRVGGIVDILRISSNNVKR